MYKPGLSGVVLAATLFLCVLLVSPPLFADSYARIVRLSDADGSVDIDRNTGQGFERALLNMPITQGVRLKTGMTGRAEVEFENGSVIRLAGDTFVAFTQLSLRSDGERVSDVEVGEGTVYVNYRDKKAGNFRISVGNRSFALSRDVRFRMLVDRSEAEIAVFKGELRIEGPSETAKVKKNETFTLDLEDGARYTLAKGISTIPTDEYDREREQYLDQAGSNSYGSPYSYGYRDMSRYGAFFDAPGYGLVWRPYGIGYGWDPYSAGYWAYYPSQGYIWISSFPWGWTPYRYGNWVYLSSYGWCWRPGGWNRWNPGIAVYNPPAAWKAPSPPPTTGSGTTVPVGNPPAPRPRRAIETDDIVPRRVTPNRNVMDRRNPRGQEKQQETPSATTPAVPSAPAANNKGVVPAQPGRVEVPAERLPNRLKNPPREYREDRRAVPQDKPAAVRQPQATPPSSPPTKTVAPPPTAPPRVAPSAPRSVAPSPSAPPKSVAPPPASPRSMGPIRQGAPPRMAPSGRGASKGIR